MYLWPLQPLQPMNHPATSGEARDLKNQSKNLAECSQDGASLLLITRVDHIVHACDVFCVFFHLEKKKIAKYLSKSVREWKIWNYNLPVPGLHRQAVRGRWSRVGRGAFWALSSGSVSGGVASPVFRGTSRSRRGTGCPLLSSPWLACSHFHSPEGREGQVRHV